MKIRDKLIVVFLLAVAGVVTLSINTNRVMKQSIQIAHGIKNEKLKTVLFIERIASLGIAVNAGIRASANMSTEDGLNQAMEAKAAIMELLRGHKGIVVDEGLTATLDNLALRVETVFAAGSLWVAAVIDQEFADIPEATQTFKTASQQLNTLLATIQSETTASLERSLDLLTATAARGARVGVWFSSALVGLIVGLFFFVITVVVRPIRGVVIRLKDIAQGEGDLTTRMPTGRKDEIGELAHWFNVFCEKLHATIRNITGGADTLQFSSALLTDLSSAMRSDVTIVETNAGAVKKDAGRITKNINSVASAMEETSTNIGMIASSAEEMSATIGEIAQNAEKARHSTRSAVTQATAASDRIRLLGDAVLKIGKVTETITEISDQTNLLALNATIEAARAGEAGKGFAVVANEIKGLAVETAAATKEISAQIEEIQETARDSVKEVTSISAVMQNIDDIVGTIAASIEEQSSATREIAGNVANASEGINEVNNAMASSATGVEGMSGQVAGIHEAAAKMDSRSLQANLSAEDLASIARQMNVLVNQFKLREAKFDMGAVKGAHLSWRYKLHAVINNHDRLDPAMVASHKECAFGKWVNGPEGQSLADEPAFRDLCETHEQVHQIAHEIVSLASRGMREKVGALMQRFEEVRERFFSALDALYR